VAWAFVVVWGALVTLYVAHPDLATLIGPLGKGAPDAAKLAGWLFDKVNPEPPEDGGAPEGHPPDEDRPEGS
jgi:hypothetical protein